MDDTELRINFLQAARGALWINGAPVDEIASVKILPLAGNLVVDVEVT